MGKRHDDALMKVIALPLGLSAVLMASCATMPQPVRPVFREFDSPRVSRVVLRANAASCAIVTIIVRDPPFVSVYGTPSGGESGYHSPDHGRRGLDFMARQFGSTLVISTENETNHFRHRSTLQRIYVMLPSRDMKFVRETRKLTRDGAADLSPPRGTSRKR
jgi:hypothetical protein